MCINEIRGHLGQSHSDLSYYLVLNKVSKEGVSKYTIPLLALTADNTRKPTEVTRSGPYRRPAEVAQVGVGVLLYIYICNISIPFSKYLKALFSKYVYNLLGFTILNSQNASLSIFFSEFL